MFNDVIHLHTHNNNRPHLWHVNNVSADLFVFVYFNILRSAVLKRKSLHLQQYQSAIRAYKAGKAVDFEELPIPPGENLHRCFFSCVFFQVVWSRNLSFTRVFFFSFIFQVSLQSQATRAQALSTDLLPR